MSGPDRQDGDERTAGDGDGDVPLLPDLTGDEAPTGWGDDRDLVLGGGEDDRDRWLREQRPPHHDRD